MLFRTGFAVLALGVMGCSEHEVWGIDHDVSAPGAMIEVVPSVLDFGSLPQGKASEKWVTVTNVGKNELVVEDLRISGLSSFVLLDEEPSFRLPPGAFKDIALRFTPEQPKDNTGLLTVYSNDPAQWAVEVPLLGDGAIAELQINPNPMDFGYEYIGCTDEQNVELRNVGGDELIIQDIEYTGDATLAVSGKGIPSLPMSLQPGEFASLQVQFAPDAEETFVGKLNVQSNDPRGWVSATQLGDGEYIDVVQDHFLVPEAPPVDILFAVDQSCSMDDDNSRLASNFSKFISTISTVTSNWRIGVVTKNDGCFKYGYLDETTSSYTAKFNNSVLADDGGTNTERLLTLSRDALWKTASGRCNSGFLRSSALLHVIMVSDEPEQSSTSWSTLVSQIQGYKSNPDDVKLSAVAGDYPSGCSTAAPGAGYYQAVSATGGEYLSICDTNWAKHVETLAAASIEGLHEYPLSDASPDPDSIVVYVDGKVWKGKWTYDGKRNQVILGSEVPENSEVTLEYGVLHTCKK